MDNRLLLPTRTVLDGSYRIKGVIGSGGFGVTYACEDVHLGTAVALKEYYPIEFGERDASMSVRPKSERHTQTFEWGRTSFLREARMLARFRHPSIVRVTRVFEANATAYMVMDFENGQTLEVWLRSLRRPPTQDELDRIASPLLDALELMHAESFLHRDIAPDNIIVRPDGTPVLLDFGASRRAIAEVSRSLTGIVKAGYSPQEQYATDSRLQGPWSDIYALGATFYRAVVGAPPEEATLRMADDRMRPAAQAAKGTYRAGFLRSIDACLNVRHGDRPQSIARLRPLLLADVAPTPKPRVRYPAGTRAVPGETPHSPPTKRVAPRVGPGKWRSLAAAGAVLLVLVTGIYAGLEYTQSQRQAEKAEQDRKLAEEARRRSAEKREQEAKEARAPAPAPSAVVPDAPKSSARPAEPDIVPKRTRFKEPIEQERVRPRERPKEAQPREIGKEEVTTPKAVTKDVPKPAAPKEGPTPAPREALPWGFGKD